jgi:hypothetical protein
VGDELVGYTNVDVSIKERIADFAKDGIEVLLGELALATKILEGSLELFS